MAGSRSTASEGSAPARPEKIPHITGDAFFGPAARGRGEGEMEEQGNSDNWLLAAAYALCIAASQL
jgi:hypothetical protein